jgi:hypothetical protein
MKGKNAKKVTVVGARARTPSKQGQVNVAIVGVGTAPHPWFGRYFYGILSKFIPA